MKILLIFFAGITNIFIALISSDRKWPPFLILTGFFCMYYAVENFIADRKTEKSAATNGNEPLNNNKP